MNAGKKKIDDARWCCCEMVKEGDEEEDNSRCRSTLMHTTASIKREGYTVRGGRQTRIRKGQSSCTFFLFVTNRLLRFCGDGRRRRK